MSDATDANLYRYVGNAPTNFVDPSGLFLQEAWDWAGDTWYDFFTSDAVYNTVDKADEFFAGFGNVLSGGITNKLRARGEFGYLAVQNQQGGFYNAGSLAGLGVAIYTGFKSAALLGGGGLAAFQGLNVASKALVAYDVAATAIGVAQGATNIARGEGTVFDVLAVLPGIGPARKFLGDLGVPGFVDDIPFATPGISITDEVGRLAADVRDSLSLAFQGLQRRFGSVPVFVEGVETAIRNSDAVGDALGTLGRGSQRAVGSAGRAGNTVFASVGDPDAVRGDLAEGGPDSQTIQEANEAIRRLNGEGSGGDFSGTGRAITGETDATSVGKQVHRDLAEGRRVSGNFSTVNSPITRRDGSEILVPKRVDLRTGKPQPGARLQEAIPDATIFDRGIIIDDKPLGRPIRKDRQEIIRFIRAFEIREGRLPNTIAIQRYNPQTGQLVRTDLFGPNDFLP